MRFVLLACISLLLISCSSLEKQGSKDHFTLEKILSIVPDKSDLDSVQFKLGPPDMVMPIPNSDYTGWIFRDKKTGYQKLSLVFNNQKKVHSVLWLVGQDDPEIKLENSKKHFPNARFEAKDAPWENPHAAPNERFYVDNEKGISITVRTNRQEVESISWHSPNTSQSATRLPAVKYEL